MDDSAPPHRARLSLESQSLDEGGAARLPTRRCTSEESLCRLDAGLDTPDMEDGLHGINAAGGPAECTAPSALAVSGAPSADEPPTKAPPPPDVASAPSQPLVLEWRRLRAFVRVPDMAAPKRWCSALRSPPMRRRQILFGVSGVAKPGALLGVLGPSGSGKTSLLSILGGRSEAEVHGFLMVNGAPGLPKAVRRRIGFVTQDDLMWQALTVEATLTYASELRLPESLPRDQKVARVEHIIRLLGLEKCRGTQIGGALQRGVSGGERKRVSIALELLTDPALLLLDEPTSGLDSTIAAKLIATLRGLSMAGRAIVASIHQPSTRVFRSFDVVMLLAEGRVLYHGPPDDVGAHFGALGHALPSSMNPAEWLLDLASAEPGVGGEAARSALLDAYAAAHPEPPPTRGEDERHVYGRKPPGALMRLLTRHKADINAPPPPLAGQAKWATSFAKQVAVLTRRNIAARAEGVLDTWRVGQVIAVAILSGLLWLHVGKHWHDEKGIGDIAGLIFFALLFNVFLSLFGALFAFPNERAITVKERRGGWFRLASYYIARTLADLPLELVIPTGFIIILFWMASLRAAAFVPIVLIMLLSVLISSSLGLLLSAVTMDLKRSQALASVLTLVIMLTGGFYIDNVPGWLVWLKWVSFITHGYSACLKLQFSAGKTYPCVVDGVAAECHVRAAGRLATVDWQLDIWVNVVILLAQLVALRVATYFALRWRLR